MAEFKAGDRVVKMSGIGAGKYGTVNSVMESGTLNVTFDGERLPKYCDPARCGQVAANAKPGDWVTLKGDPSKTTMVVDEVRRDGHFRVTAIPGAWFTDSEVDIVKRASNSRAANAVARNAGESAHFKLFQGMARAAVGEILYAAEGELRALTGKAKECADAARAQGDAKTVSDIARVLSLLKDAVRKHHSDCLRTIG